MNREMKDSGIAWIGEIPAEWEICRLKDIGSLYGGLTGKSGDDFNVEDGDSYAYFIPFTNIFNNSIIDSEKLSKVKIEEGENQNSVLKGDLLFLMSSEDLDGIGKCALLNTFIPNLYLNSFCKGFRLSTEKVNSSYLNYLMSSHILRELVRMEAKGFIRINLRQDKLSCIPIFLPLLQEQRAIAEFLDRKCGEIDELIALQDRMIEELKAYKQSVITEAVTRGLNPDAPLRDSGIEWIGAIPQHWKVSKIKNENYILDYLRQPISAEKRINELGLYDYYGASGVIDKIDDYNVNDKVLLIGEDGANLIFRNLPLIYKAEGKFWVNNHAHILKVKDTNDYEYMFYMLEAGDYFLYITGSAQPKLSQDNLKNYIIPIPPLSEQQQIAEFLDTKCEEIDSLIALKQTKIEQLKEYKKSLIYEYVTGKKQVENLVSY